MVFYAAIFRLIDANRSVVSVAVPGRTAEPETGIVAGVSFALLQPTPEVWSGIALDLIPNLNILLSSNLSWVSSTQFIANHALLADIGLSTLQFRH
jgi:hypothetical protein